MAKILIIEDYISLLEFLSMFLKMHGYTVEGLSSTNDVHQVVKDFDPDVILLDVLLGGYDGREICKQIKRINKTVSIILLSANPKLLQNYEECEADDAIEKPFDNANILKRIKYLLDKKGV
jgi:DNA-binding response OmpR family regulator